MELISIMEECLGRSVLKRMFPMQPVDVSSTYADVDDLMRDAGFKPATPLANGVRQFADWYRSFYPVRWVSFEALVPRNSETIRTRESLEKGC